MNAPTMMRAPVVAARGLSKEYGSGPARVRAVRGVDLDVANLDSEATTDVLRLFEQLRADGQTLVLVTHDERMAATADRLLTMRDGVLVHETRLTGGSAGSPGAITGLRE